MTPIPELFAQGVPLKEIARQHGMTVLRLRSRLEAMGLRRYVTLTLPEAERLRGLSHMGDTAAAFLSARIKEFQGRSQTPTP